MCALSVPLLYLQDFGKITGDPCLECCCEMCTLPRDDVVVVILTDGVNPFGAMLSTFVIIGIINSWLCCATFGETGFS